MSTGQSTVSTNEDQQRYPSSKLLETIHAPRALQNSARGPGPRFFRLGLLGSALALALCRQASAGGNQDLPSPQEILRKVAERSGSAATNSQSGYLCIKQTVTEEFDSAGRIVESKVRVKQTHSDSGGIAEANKWSKENGFSLDEELLRRYAFNVADRVMLNGRPTLLLTFGPNTPPPPVQRFQDRLLNRVVGSIWVDEQNSEVAKADLCLGTPVSFGILGAVDRFTFSFERFQADDGRWMTHWTDVSVRARKFVIPVRMRQRVDYTDFQKPTPSPP